MGDYNGQSSITIRIVSGPDGTLAMKWVENILPFGIIKRLKKVSYQKRYVPLLGIKKLMSLQ
jgi:hypothetical protein